MLAKLLRDTMRAGSFESYADLMDAWKAALAKARIAWTNDELAEAMTMVESNTPLLWTKREAKPVEPEPDPRPMTRDEAAALVARLRKALNREAAKGRHEPIAVTVKPVPAAPKQDVDVNAFRREAGLWNR